MFMSMFAPIKPSAVLIDSLIREWISEGADSKPGIKNKKLLGPT